MGFFRKLLIPHKENDHKPHLLRESGLLVLSIVILLVFVSASSGRYLISRGEYSAAVIASVLVDLANQDRTLESLGGLKINPTLEKAALLKAQDMASKGYFAHKSPDGKTPWYWFKEAGYEFAYAGENLAVNFSDSVDVNQAWMNSPGHRRNIMNGNFTEVGIATAEGTFEGRPTVFVVQLFGKPARAAALSLPATTTAVVSSTPAEVSLTETPTLATIASSEVLSAEGEGSELFVAVKNAEVLSEEDTSSAEIANASSLDILFSSPGTFLSFAYLILASLVSLSLLAFLFIEIKRHHARHILYALLLLALIAILFYLYHAVLFAPLRIL